MTRRTSPAAPETTRGGAARYRARSFDAQRHDPYQVAGKYTEPTRCSACDAVFRHGRWQWGSAPPGSHVALCPACQRIRDKLPAGELTLEGAFIDAHRDEIVRLVRNQAERERQEHPLNRIIDVADGPRRIHVSTTDIHLPQRIGDALERAYDGELDIDYGHDEYTVRVRWQR
jgi:hypothetical protein